MIIVQASHLNRVIACNGSIRMGGSEELSPNSADQTEAAREGSAMHEIMRDVLKDRRREPIEFIDRQMTNGIYVTAEMAETVEKVCSAIIARGFTGEVETNVDWETNGIHIAARADHIAYDETTLTLYLDDPKFGWRLIEPEGNWALLAYVIGWIKRYGIMPLEVVMTIHQPRPFHEDGKTREWRLPMGELLTWQVKLENHLANVANNETLVTGEHCYKCPALSFCPAARAAGMFGIDVSRQAFKDKIPDAELAFMLDALERANDHLSSLIDAYKELGLHRAKSGAIITGYVVENPLGNRFWKREATPELVAALTGRDLTVTKLVTPAEAERRGVDETTIGLLSTRAHTGERLKRKDISRAAKKLLTPKGK